MFLLNGLKFIPEIQQTIGDVQYPHGWFLNPLERIKLGVTEVPDPIKPEDSLFTSVENPDGSYTATPRTAEEITAYQAAKDEMQAKSIRNERNDKLAKTDWRYRRDQTTTPEWDAYCQALRDVPAQEGFPWTITWPVAP